MRRILSNPRSGSALIFVLLVLAGMVVIVGSLQYLAIGTIRSTRKSLADNQASQRADALVRLYVGRWKHGVAYQAPGSPDFPGRGQETGTWDGLDYQVGWHRDDIDTSPMSYRLVVWVRFPDIPPARSFRYDLEIKVPTALKPRPFRIVSLDRDDVDPLDEEARRQAFSDSAPDQETQLAQAASAEVMGYRITELAEAGAPSNAVVSALSGRNEESLKSSMKRVLEAFHEYKHSGGTAARESAAAEELSAAAVLPGALGDRWTDMARYHTAEVLMRRARTLTGIQQTAVLQQAILALTTALGDGACCGGPLVAWLWAQATMLLRADWSDPAQLRAARIAAIRGLREAVAGDEDAPLHDGTDIRRRELLSFMEGLWSARIAFGMKTEGGPYVLASVRQDGREAIIHQESDRPLKPLGWTADGGRLISVVGSSGWGQKNISMGMAGSDIKEIVSSFTDTSGQENGSVRFRDVVDLAISPNGRALVVTGTVFDTGGEYPEEVGMESTYKQFAQAEPLKYFHQNYLVRDVDREPEFVAQFDEVTDASTRITSRNVFPPVFSPDGTQALQIQTTGASGGAGYRSGDTLQLVTTPVGPGTDASTPVVVALLPAPDGNSHLVGLDWRRIGLVDWVAFARLPVTGTGPAIAYVASTATLPWVFTMTPFNYEGSPHVDARVYGGLSDVQKKASLIASPAGYLVAGKSNLYHFNLSPTPAPPTVLSPAAGSLGEITSISVPSWGDVIFFTARSDGSDRHLYLYDLVSNTTTKLVGDGAVFSDARDVIHIAVSPTPDPG